MTAITHTIGPLGIAVITLDVPGEPVNSFGASAIHEFDAMLSTLAADASVRAVVLISGKQDNFVAGADINQFVALETAEEGEALSRAGQEFVGRVERFPKPIVVAIHGSCLGLGTELSIACAYRVASDHPKTAFGLPEVQLGILPGAGGCNRLPRLIGARAALDLILTGKTERAAKALKLGLVDEVVPQAILLETAIKAADWLAREGVPKRRRGGGVPAALLDGNPFGRRLVYRGARAAVMKKTRGQYPAPLRALDVVRTGLEEGMVAGLRAEARGFGELAVSPVSRELVRIFFATTALKKDDGVAPGTAKPVKVTRLGVVGSGFMGSGVAGTAVATAKIDVRLKDTELARIGKGLKAALEIVRGQLTRKRITKPEYERLAALLSGGVDSAAFTRCQLVIEAVFEDLDVKRGVLADLEAVLPAGAVFASNTSTIPIGRIAEGARHPERVIGMHFFSPVEKMPLVEVIPAAATGADAIATTVRFGRALGKTVIVVADRPGFWVNRILSPYLIEAGLILSEGVPIDVVDRALVAFGFPVGPFALLDEVGVDVAVKGGKVMHEAFGERMTPAPAIERLLADGRLGKKAGKGLYLYHEGHKTDPDPKAYEILGVKPLAAAPTGDVERRLVYAMLNEAARAMAEGVVRSPRDGDIGAIFGIGFPPFRGGPLRRIDSLGAAQVVETLDELAGRYGPRFEPAPVLREMGGSGGRFYE